LTSIFYRGTLKEISLSLSLSPSREGGGGRGVSFRKKTWLVESGCLRVQPKTGGKFHLKLNIARDTDSSQVPCGKDEKNSEQRVKRLEIVKITSVCLQWLLSVRRKKKKKFILEGVLLSQDSLTRHSLTPHTHTRCTRSHTRTCVRACAVRCVAWRWRACGVCE